MIQTLPFVRFATLRNTLLDLSRQLFDAMTEEEIANTLYMINMDSLVCGDYCHLYGGVQDDATQTVTLTEAYDNAQ